MKAGVFPWKMSSLLTESSADNARETAAHPRVFLGYEDAEVGFRAINIWERIAGNVGADLDGDTNEAAYDELISVWSFDYFWSQKMRLAAALQAKQAAVIVLAIRKTVELPAATEAWIQLWSRCPNQHPGALMVVIDPSAGLDSGDGSVCSELYTVAARSRRSFFCYATHRCEPAPARAHRVLPESRVSSLLSLSPRISRYEWDNNG